ncbi:porphobilinogen synthase [Gammaproteobacteria bacterium]|jgi:porphobilinogen synthase|nr:porphobilinogen synthase [Gammaproteobacteria bacterium]|tara:strand:+ start:1463 stop:2455 length:993 start_codon:yes stop_codon:yes gene_type:complete
MAERKFPSTRLRRSRSKGFLRDLVAEHKLSSDDLIQPLFVSEQKESQIDIPSMPNVYRHNLDSLYSEIESILKADIKSVAIFPAIDSDKKNAEASHAFDQKNIVCEALQGISKRFPEIITIADVALDPYTDHGHDGLLVDGRIDNDQTLDLLSRQALILAEAGADIIAPSDMMDGRVKIIRDALEANNFVDTIILSYAAKYASSFYGPFRDAVGSAASLGKDSKKTYQMNFANMDEALHEVEMDINEGADIVMIKPGIAYLDVVHAVKLKFQVPTFVYQVSGEYSMLSLSIEKGWLDKNVMLESLVCCKRAGADAILTYAAKQISSELNS